jgi:hypothetical protein
MVAKAVAAGATIPNPATDYGFMYQHSFDDLDATIGNMYGWTRMVCLNTRGSLYIKQKMASDRFFALAIFCLGLFDIR